MIPETEAVYGPVHSRRFGVDLGINLLPSGRKLCNFDCVYCQFGFSGHGTESGGAFPDVDDVLRQWLHKVHLCLKQGKSIRHTTIAGNGEPTLHPGFIRFAEELIRLRNENAPFVRIAILSNGTRIYDPEIRRAVCLMDEPVLKLDAGRPMTIHGLNHPHTHLDLPSYLRDLRKCHRLVLQTMFVKGWNDSPEDLQAWTAALEEARPVSVQIYTLDRRPAMDGLEPLSDESLMRIARDASLATGISVHAYL